MLTAVRKSKAMIELLQQRNNSYIKILRTIFGRPTVKKWITSMREILHSTNSRGRINQSPFCEPFEIKSVIEKILEGLDKIEEIDQEKIHEARVFSQKHYYFSMLKKEIGEIYCDVWNGNVYIEEMKKSIVGCKKYISSVSQHLPSLEEMYDPNNNTDEDDIRHYNYIKENVKWEEYKIKCAEKEIEIESHRIREMRKRADILSNSLGFKEWEKEESEHKISLEMRLARRKDIDAFRVKLGCILRSNSP